MSESQLSLPGKVLAHALELPEGLSQERWRGVGKQFGQIEGSIMWWIGDWLNYGERRWGEIYKEAIEITGKDYSTLVHAASMASKFELGRRRPNLTWSHHREVAALDPPIADTLLARAEQQDLSRNQVRQEVKQQKRAERQAIPPSLPAASDRFRVFNCAIDGLEVENGTVDCIITDPPYPKEFVPLYGTLAKQAIRWLKPGGSLIAMCGQSWLPQVLAELTAVDGMSYQWTLAYLTPGGQAVQIFPRHVNTFWKPLLWLVKGNYTGPWLGDVTKSDPNANDKRFHHWGQSESGMADIVMRFTSPGQVIVDPFCGGGTTGVVSVALGRFFIGADIDDEHVRTTLSRLHEVANAAAAA